MPLTLGSSRSLEVVTEKIRSFGGRVEEVTPGMTVGVFGIVPVDDAPRRTAHAALAIRMAAERARGSELSAPRLRMAITVDEVLTACTGGEISIDTDVKRQALDGERRRQAARARL